MKCTKCQKGEMEEYLLLTEEVDRCNNCYSIFLDEEEMYIVRNLSKDDIEKCTRQKYKKHNKEDLESIEKVYKFRASVTCPKCNTGMTEYNYAYDSPVIIQRCHKCSGVFLDADDFYIIRDFLDGKFRDEEKIAAAKLKLALEYEKRYGKEKEKEISKSKLDNQKEKSENTKESIVEFKLEDFKDEFEAIKKEGEAKREEALVEEDAVVKKYFN